MSQEPPREPRSPYGVERQTSEPWRLFGPLRAREFGAKCDGTTDDTTAIQSAIPQPKRPTAPPLARPVAPPGP